MNEIKPEIARFEALRVAVLKLDGHPHAQRICTEVYLRVATRLAAAAGATDVLEPAFTALRGYLDGEVTRAALEAAKPPMRRNPPGIRQRTLGWRDWDLTWEAHFVTHCVMGVALEADPARAVFRTAGMGHALAGFPQAAWNRVHADIAELTGT
jgi:hypothetical protein